MKAILKASFLLSLFCLFSNVIASDKFYYTHSARDLEINSKDETLLVFTSPPVAQMCQPSNIVQMLPVDQLSDLQALSIPQGTDYMGHAVEVNTPPMATFLKVIPLKEQKTTCNIKLANGENIPLNVIPTPLIQRPIIELKNIYNDSTESQYPKTEVLNLFRSFLSGGKLTEFKDISPNESTIKSTNKGNYQIIYLGTNNVYNAWIVNSIFSKDFENIPRLKKIKVGELYFSALVEKENKKTPSSIVKEKSYQLFILSKSDLTTSELLEKLP